MTGAASEGFAKTVGKLPYDELAPDLESRWLEYELVTGANSTSATDGGTEP